jgi:hypothetical protein
MVLNYSIFVQPRMEPKIDSAEEVSKPYMLRQIDQETHYKLNSRLMKPLIFLASMSLAHICLTANAQQAYPSAVDLKAAYCLEIKKSAFELVKDTRGLTTELDFRIDKLKNEIDRLKTFLLTRVGYIDPLPILASTKAAKSDWKSTSDLSELCFDKVDKTRPYEEYSVKAQECMKTTSPETVERFKTCNSLNWLPY